MTTDPFNPAIRDGESLAAVVSSERHRAKNTLQVVASLLSLQAREVPDTTTKQLFLAAQDRVRAIAIMYERLSKSGSSGRLDFSDALKELVAATVRSQPSPLVSSQVLTDPLQLDLDTAIPLGLVAYELLSDALLNAFQGRATGHIDVTLRVSGSSSEGVLGVGDDGAQRSPMSSNDTLRGKIVDVLIRQLKARLTLESVSGTKLVVRFPLPV